MADPNVPLFEEAVEKLAPFLDEVVFVGGIVLGFLITDPGAAPVRATDDVDVIAQIVTYADYIEFSERFRKAGFTEDDSETPLTCRWHHGALIVDVLPLSKDVLGFTNRWYGPAMENASRLTLANGRSIRMITAPFFLGTKFEAFRGRGKLDYLASHDLEDFIAIIEGRNSLVLEIVGSSRELQDYLAEAANSLLSEPRFLDALPGFVLDSGRVSIIEERLKSIAGKARGKSN